MPLLKMPHPHNDGGCVVENFGCVDPLPHKECVYRFFEGSFRGSWSLGKLFNYDSTTQDARTCSTCANLCGVECALREQDDAAFRHEKDAVQARIFFGIAEITDIHSEAAFGADNYVSTWDTGDNGVLTLVHFSKSQTMIGLFNFTVKATKASLNMINERYVDLKSRELIDIRHVQLGAYEMKVLL